MTEQEKHLMVILAKAWDLFQNLPVLHPDDTTDFRYHIHRLEDMIAARQAILEFNRKAEAVSLSLGYFSKETPYKDSHGNIIKVGDTLLHPNIEGVSTNWTVKYSEQRSDFVGDNPNEIWDLGPVLFHKSLIVENEQTLDNKGR